MPLAVAVQMDPIETIKIGSDTSFALMLEAQTRGHALWVYEPRHLAWREGEVSARGRSIRVRDVAGDHFEAGPWERRDLASFDVVLMRQDPPFDMAYVTATHILEHLAPTTLVVNDPVGVRNAPEKLLVTHFAHLMPPTLVTADMDALRAFRAAYGDIVIKPLYGMAGGDVFRLQPDDTNANALLELFSRVHREPIMAQAFLPAIAQGDKRIVLVEGEIAGALNRIPAAGDIRSNLAAGGRGEAATLSARDREICAAVGPTLRDQGLLFAGLDVIGGYLTEINVTSPTGLRAIERLDGTRVTPIIWDAIEARRASCASTSP